MLDKTLGGIWSQPDILSELNEGASPFSYLNGRLLNMIDPTGMMADSTTRVPGAEASSSTTQTTNTKSSEAIPLNHYQVPYGGSGNTSSGNYNLN